MNETVIVIGASGHGKVIADIIIKSGDKLVGFLDDDETLGGSFWGYPLLGKVKDYSEYMDCSFVVAIGNAAIRGKIYQQMHDVRWYTAIHPNAFISHDVQIGDGTVIMAGAVINPGVSIGVGCIINTCASVDHDCVVGNFVHVSVGSHFAGNVHIGNNSWIGIGAVVSNNIDICGDCMVGAGAVVVRDILEPGTYVGVPAKKISD